MTLAEVNSNPAGGYVWVVREGRRIPHPHAIPDSLRWLYWLIEKTQQPKIVSAKHDLYARLESTKPRDG